MVKLEDFKKHLQTIKQEDWERLFTKLPEIEKAKSFGEEIESKQIEEGVFTFPYWESASIVDDVIFIINELNLVPVYDWNSWKEGHSILENKEFDFSTLDTFTLCKFFTIIVRANRFIDGFLIDNFINGNIFKIISAIKQNQLV